MAKKTFSNENFEEVTLSVSLVGEEVVVDCKTARNRELQRWTRREAVELRDLLREALA